MVNGVTVSITRNRPARPSVAPATSPSSLNSKNTVNNIVREETDLNSSVSTGENRSLTYTDTEPTTSPTTYRDDPTRVSWLPKSEWDWEGKETNGEDDYDEDEDDEGEGSRVTRGIKSSPQWKLNGKMVGKGKRDWGAITFERRGTTLNLSSVRQKDSGNYSCHHQGRERFSVKVVIEGESKQNERKKIKLTTKQQNFSTLQANKRKSCHHSTSG